MFWCWPLVKPTGDDKMLGTKFGGKTPGPNGAGGGTGRWAMWGLVSAANKTELIKKKKNHSTYSELL